MHEAYTYPFAGLKLIYHELHSWSWSRVIETNIASYFLWPSRFYKPKSWVMLRKMKYEIILNASYIQWSKTVVRWQCTKWLHWLNNWFQEKRMLRPTVKKHEIIKAKKFYLSGYWCSFIVLIFKNNGNKILFRPEQSIHIFGDSLTWQKAPRLKTQFWSFFNYLVANSLKTILSTIV